ncbi:hypothetical protein FRC00_014111, partial [Tulasnella sp. 408]
VAPLHHPKPTSGSVRFGGVQDGPTLVIPPPPLLSSSPSSTTSVDTTPNTPGSNSSSSPNLASLVPPAFLKRLRQSSIAYVDPNISDEDDVPLGVVVIKKHSDDRDKPVSSPSKDDPQERARRHREKEQEKEKRKLKDAERKKAFKEQVLASRIRSQAHRVGGRLDRGRREQPAVSTREWDDRREGQLERSRSWPVTEPQAFCNRARADTHELVFHVHPVPVQRQVEVRVRQTAVDRRFGEVVPERAHAADPEHAAPAPAPASTPAQQRVDGDDADDDRRSDHGVQSERQQPRSAASAVPPAVLRPPSTADARVRDVDDQVV